MSLHPGGVWGVMANSQVPLLKWDSCLVPGSLTPSGSGPDDKVWTRG